MTGILRKGCNRGRAGNARMLHDESTEMRGGWDDEKKGNQRGTRLHASPRTSFNKLLRGRRDGVPFPASINSTSKESENGPSVQSVYAPLNCAITTLNLSLPPSPFSLSPELKESSTRLSSGRV